MSFTTASTDIVPGDNHNLSGGSSIDQANSFFIEHPRIIFVRLHWIDYSGVLRTRYTTKAVAHKLASGHGRYSLAQNCMIIPVSTAPACWPDGIEGWELQPDWTSLRQCGHDPTHALVLCHTAHTGLPDPLSRCPRKALSDAMAKLKESHPTDVLLGFEVEFVLLDGDYHLASSMDCTVGYSMSAGLRAKNLTIMDEIVKALDRSGIATYHFHVELQDQYEIALAPLPPIEAVDALMVAQETIRTVCLRHGLRASLAPKPTLRGVKNGLHVHLSLDAASDEAGESFLAGVLGKTRALCAFGLANFDSYERVAGDCAGEWVAYGTGNKDLPVRKVRRNHWEFRALDVTANVYLYIAALLRSGLSGMRSSLRLTSQDCQVVPSALSVSEARQKLGELGHTESMPRSLADSLAFLGSDDHLCEALGEEMVRQYMKVKAKEIEHFGKMADEERMLKIVKYF